MGVTNDLGHIVKGVVSVGDVGKLGAVCVLVGYLGGSAGVVIFVRRQLIKNSAPQNEVRRKYIYSA